MKLSLQRITPCNMLSTNSTQCASTINSSLKLAKSSWDLVNGVKSAQCLVSKAAKLRDKWMEFQGIKNWEGLLDPLDDNLRQEILRYGEFVEVAYRCFNFDTSSSDYARCRYPKNSMLTQCGLDKKGYKVTKNLHATSGVQIPNWAHKMPSWVGTQSSWIGYVAVCTDKNEISRLGRRDIVVAYRGTATILEWLENLRTTLTPLPVAKDGNTSMVQSGFLSLYTTSRGGRRSLQDSIREEINKILQKYADEPISITVTGHSLGAALATLTAHDITTTFKHAPLVTVVSFGGPRIGNKSFRLQLEKSGTKVLRIVNCDDPITKVPGFFLDEKNIINLLPMISNWIEKRIEVYAEIGKELKLSSRDYPHLSNGNVATCHDLKTYMYLVDNFVSSKYGLRDADQKQKLKQQILV